MSALNIISTDKAFKPNGHYSQAIEANGFIFTSVQLGLTPYETQRWVERLSRNLILP